MKGRSDPFSELAQKDIPESEPASKESPRKDQKDDQRFQPSAASHDIRRSLRRLRIYHVYFFT